MPNPIKKFDAPPATSTTLDGLLSEAVKIENPDVQRAVLKAIIQTANICHNDVQARIDSDAESEWQNRVYYRG